MDNGQLIASLVGGLLGLLLTVSLFVLFLLISREITGWYFKTNEIIKLLKQIVENIQETEE
jgi:Na+-driven multidrug efflux pump